VEPWCAQRAFAYSLTDYIALGLVVEKVTGHSVAQELTRRIVEPLRLSDTELPSTRKVAGLHDPDRNGINPALLWAASGIVSTARHLSRFFSALLSGRLVPRASLNAMEHTVQDPHRPDRFGLGLLAFDLSCGTFWGRTGTLLGDAAASTGNPKVAAGADGNRVAVVVDQRRRTRPEPRDGGAALPLSSSRPDTIRGLVTRRSSGIRDSAREP